MKYRIDMKPYVTIVVPFWNAATTLSNCIDSVLNQTRNDWELILVDDGSVDDGYKICAQYAEKDNRIRLLCRDHEGVGAARNAAMDETQGKFICFVDADDFVEPNYLEKLCSCPDVDLVVCGYMVDEYILIGLLAISSLTACTEKKKSNIIIAPKPVAKVVNKATQKMSDYEQTREADWVGSHYKVVVKRSSDKELPVLQLDENTKYYDNRISVKVLRSDGSEFFSRTFTKKDFTSYIDKHTQDMGALLGIVYVKAEGDYLYFAASVGSPDVTSDEYVPLVLKISRMGSISISKDEKLDTNASAEEEEDGV